MFARVPDDGFPDPFLLGFNFAILPAEFLSLEVKLGKAVFSVSCASCLKRLTAILWLSSDPSFQPSISRTTPLPENAVAASAASTSVRFSPKWDSISWIAWS
ncbi:MAG: hypothetical protein ABSA97_14490 [Verrucomicrobiia bacterium]